MELKSEQWLQVKELFETALEMDSSARRLYLNREEIPLELREMASNLCDAHEEAGSFLDHRTLMAADAGAESAPRRFQADTVLLERFRIVRFLARGGMGEVYEAEDLELRAHVALKTIRPEIAGIPGALNRFKREVYLARQVTHPNVCRIFDLFRHRDPVRGDLFLLSMELLRGPTLGERLRSGGPFDSEMAAAILHQIASALGAAHAAGILHRDLKPGNIVLESPPCGELRAVIADFGMALSRVAEFGPSLAGGAQTAFGTPEFMSPEQIEGKPLTPASDIYSLGLVTYQMMTGARAFDADTPLISALRRLTEHAPLPSRVRPDLDPQWDRIVSRCLHRNPEHRFSSAAEFAAALPAAALPARRRPLRLRRRLAALPGAIGAWALSHRVIAASVLAAAIVASGCMVVLSRQRPKPLPSGGLTVVLADFVNTTGEPAFDQTLNTALYVKLQQSPFLNLMPDAQVRQALRYMGQPESARLTRALARQVCLREGGQVVLQGTISTGTGGYDLWLHAFDCATGKLIAGQRVAAGARDSPLTALDEAADGLRARLGESMGSIRQYGVSLIDASTASLDALTAYSRGLRVTNEQGQVAAEPDFLHAVQIDPNFAIAYARLSSIYADMGEPERARQAAIDAYEHRFRVSEWERFFILSCYYAFATGELDKEMQTYQEWGRIYPHDTVWPTGLMIDESYFGRLDKAEEMARLQIRNAPGTAAAYGNLAEIYLAQDRPDEAAAILDQADRAHLYEINLDWERYLLDFYNQDTAGMSAVLAHANDEPGLKETLLEQQAATEAYEARMNSSRDSMRQAIAAADGAGDRESAAVWLAEEALWEAEYGMKNEARADLIASLHSPAGRDSKDAEILAALAAAALGDERLTLTLSARLSQDHPLDSLLHQYWLPVIGARMALDREKPGQAIKMLDSTKRYETGIMDPLPSMYAVYVRALALQAAGKNVQAAAGFRELLAHRGLVLNSPIGALSRLYLARSLRQSHDTAGSRQAYGDLLAVWKDADAASSLPRLAAIESKSLH